MSLKVQTTFCVTHEEPLVPQKFIDFAIGIGEYRPERGAHISKLDPFWDSMRPLAYGAAGNYVLPRAAALLDPAPDVIALFSHRKIVVRSPAGCSAKSYPAFREISEILCNDMPVEEARARSGQDFLISSPIEFPQGMIRQYAEAHIAADMYEYLTIGIQCGAISPAVVQIMARENLFIPGGCELGIYPAEWLIQTLARIEKVGREFVMRCAARIRTYDKYQVRAVGFLAERLGSHLLLKELRRRFPDGAPHEIIGHICAITREGEHYQGAVVG